MTLDESILAKRAARKRWRDKNKEKAKALSMAWSKKNRDRINKLFRDRYAKNKEFYNAKTKAKRDKNREKFNEWSRNWKKKNPGYLAKRSAYEAKRKALMLGCRVECEKINLTISQWKSSNSIACSYCGQNVSGTIIHIDHIVPLSRGGSHSIENICPSCPSCNLQKGAKTPEEWAANKRMDLYLAATALTTN